MVDQAVFAQTVKAPSCFGQILSPPLCKTLGEIEAVSYIQVDDRWMQDQKEENSGEKNE
jgi:hypothetical protein